MLASDCINSILSLMSEVPHESIKDSFIPAREHVQYILEPIFEEKPELDWVALGLSSKTVFRAGTDAELPSELEFFEWEKEADEWLEIFGRPVYISDGSGVFIED